MPGRLPLLLCASAVIGSAALTDSASAQSMSDRLAHLESSRQRARANDGATHLSRLLYRDITVTFEATPIRDALSYLHQVTGVPIVGLYQSDSAFDGIDRDIVITLDVANQPAMSVLEMVLDQCDQGDGPCTWQLHRGMIEVSTKERLARTSARTTRYYPLDDLIMEPLDFENAPELDLDAALQQGNRGGSGGGSGGGGFGGSGGSGGSGGGSGGGSIISPAGEEPERIPDSERIDAIADLIRTTVEPDGWLAQGGDWARISIHQGVLIVRAPDFVHRQINGYPFALTPARAAAQPLRDVSFGRGASRIRER